MSDPVVRRCLDQSSVQTVVNLADHMKWMCRHAKDLQRQFSALERGYFTPSEDEQVEHVWVSYHKSRSALLELIAMVQQSVGNVTGQHAGEFAVAYAAALVLVDAARFLRDLFHQHDLVRRKLNEPLLLYGIEANGFDKIQLSLTDPTNAVQLKQANAFYDRHCAELHALAEDDEGFCRVIGVIEELRDSVDVPATRYVKARIAERGRHARDQLIKRNMSRAVYAVQEFGSRLVSSISIKPRHVARLPVSVIEDLQAVLQPGDIFVTRKDNAVTNYFLPGYWPHAALYVGQQRVVESLKDGVRERTMDSPFGNDAVAVIRPKLDALLIQEAICRAHTHVGKPYDFDFDFTRADRMVCTEVVYRSYEGLGGIAFELTRRAGRETLSAEDLLGLAVQDQQFSQVAVFCAKFSDEIMAGDAMTDVLRRTMAPAVPG